MSLLEQNDGYYSSPEQSNQSGFNPLSLATLGLNLAINPLMKYGYSPGTYDTVNASIRIGNIRKPYRFLSKLPGIGRGVKWLGAKAMANDGFSKWMKSVPENTWLNPIKGFYGGGDIGNYRAISKKEIAGLKEQKSLKALLSRRRYISGHEKWGKNYITRHGEEAFTKYKESLDNKINAATKLRNNAIKDLAKDGKLTAGKIAAKNAMRVAMIAGKGFAAYNIASIAWDLTKLVAEPTGEAIGKAINKGITSLESLPRAEMGGQLAMGYLSGMAATERQRAVQALSKSYLNGRSAFGSEASMMHR